MALILALISDLLLALLLDLISALIPPLILDLIFLALNLGPYLPNLSSDAYFFGPYFLALFFLALFCMRPPFCKCRELFNATLSLKHLFKFSRKGSLGGAPGLPSPMKPWPHSFEKQKVQIKK